MPADIQRTVREGFARTIASGEGPDDLDIGLEMSQEYGLTSLNKVLFLTSVCQEAGVPLTTFTEQDLAGMRTLGDVIDALGRHAENGS